MLIIDCQATGSTPAHGHLTELAWAVLDSGELQPTSESLVGIPEDAQIPPMIAKITGITHALLKGAPDPTEVRDLLAADVARCGFAVAHFAAFERRFLNELFHGFPLPLLCTHEIAQRLLPDIPRRGLRPLAGYFGAVLPELKRAAPHIGATEVVWTALVKRLADAGVHTQDDLKAWMKRVAPKRRGGRGYPLKRARRLGLPDVPGVYRMVTSGGDVLYVGKATSLKRRVNAYYQKRLKDDRLRDLLTQVRELDITETATPLEAALLEGREIRSREPPYNKAMRRRGDQTWFASADLSSVQPQPNECHLVGPWPPTRESIDALALLANSLATDPEDLLPNARLAVGSREPWAPALEIFRDGLQLFREAQGLTGGSLAELLRVGGRLWRAEAPPKDDAPEDVEPNVIWTPEGVAHQMEKVVTRGAQLIRRSNWLCQLSEANVIWDPPTADRRLLIIQGGQIMDVRPLPQGVPAPERSERTRLERQRDIDGKAYDQLRVLTTELKRLRAEDRQVRVILSPRCTLAGTALDRRLRGI